MKTKDIFIRAAKSLKEAKIRTALTALAIAVGATTITLALAVGAAGRAFIKDQEAAFGLGESAYVSISMPMKTADDEVKEFIDTPVSDESLNIPQGAAADNLLTKQTLSMVAALDGVKSVVPSYDIDARSIHLDAEEKKFVAPYFSVNIENVSPLNPRHVMAGSIPSVYPGKAVISADYAKAFQVTPEQLVGKTVVLAVENMRKEVKEFSFTITAVTNDQTYRSDFMEIDVTDAEKIANYQFDNNVPVYTAIVLPDGSVEMNELVTAIQNKDLTAYSSEFGKESATEAINIAQWGLVGFGVIALLAAVFGIINTQYISVLERTRQIGLMKALGSSRRDVARLFRYEAAWVGLIGGLLGVFVAYLISLTTPLLLELIGAAENTTLFIFEPLTIAIVLVSLVIVAVLSGYFPARKAARLDPIEALRTE